MSSAKITDRKLSLVLMLSFILMRHSIMLVNTTSAMKNAQSMPNNIRKGKVFINVINIMVTQLDWALQI